jgi:hypothetical protein
MSNRSDRDGTSSSSSSTDPYADPPTVAYEDSATVTYEDAATVPYMEAAPESSGDPSPHLRRAPVAERKITLRDLAVPTPNRQPTQRYLDRLPPSDPPPPPGAEDLLDGGEDPTAVRISTEPVTFYIERDSIPAPSDPSATATDADANTDTFDSSPTRPLPTLDEATTQIKANQRPSAMNLGKLASPRFGGAGEPVRIASGKPSAMRLNRVDALFDVPSDATTDAPVETPTEIGRNSLSGQRLHRVLPILTGAAFVAIGAAIAMTFLRAPAKVAVPAPTTKTTLTTTATLAPRTAASLSKTATASSPSSPPAPTSVSTTAPAAAETAPVVAPASPATPVPPVTPSTRRKKAPSRPSSPPSPAPKTQGDGLGDLPF